MKKLVTDENDVKAIVKRWFDKWTAWSYAPIQNGMGVHGIPDRVGCVPVVITQAMVGKTIGLFVAVEVKKPGRRGEKLAGATSLQLGHLRDILAAAGFSALVDRDSDMVLLSLQITANAADNTEAAIQLTRRVNNRG